MIHRANSTVFLASWIDACALWRMYIPHLNLPGSTFFCFANKPDWNQIAGCDTVVVQRLGLQIHFEFLKMVRALDMKVVYDLDDNMWEIPPKNPAYEVLKNQREGFKHCMRMTDVISVSTKSLVKAVKNHVKNLVNPVTGKEIPVVVTENRIDERLFAIPRKRKELIVGWAGSTSHVGDLELVDDTLIQVAKEYPQAVFEFRGLEPAAKLMRVSNVRHKLWQPVAEFCTRMPLWGWSIALAPVTDEDFNNSKSAIKMVEAAYCQIPCLASWMAPYDYFTSFDPELRWLLCAGKNNWGPKLRDLLNDEARREHLG